MSSSPKSPRKVPHCTKCKRPRAGHPRSGCPYMDNSDTPSTTSSAPPSPRKLTPEVLGIDNGLRRLQIRTPAEDQAEKRRRRQSSPVRLVRTETLQSLSTEASEIIRGLQQPGLLHADPDEVNERVTRWQEEVATPRKAGQAGSVPERLVTQSPTPAPEIPRRRQSQTLHRTLSAEERQNFLQRLATATKSSPANVYVLNATDIPGMAKEAKERGFYARTFIPKEQSADEKQGLLVLGRNREAVDALLDKSAADTATNGFKSCVAGVVVGAVATWGSLAFA
ncbi:hypothetical protein PHLCEN_2v10717 [Hermanssonia centrifuga]|uniref:Uncharacterized protein n=1 Tax=Hermanssonia centrifuga TaxID=98765 RepID=A0A2R6NM10_9APHY|nr:hypothetical protein PHLCEN_2v10717 [Hermanssonia centrifuga]